jgi:polyhydroxyalkanoate synthase
MQPGSPGALLAAISQSSTEVGQSWMRALPQANPSQQRAYFDKQARLWAALASGRRETLAEPDPADRRFAASEWRENPYYDYLKQSYLLAARYVEDLIDAAQLEPQEKERTRFAARQWMDAMCPANFPGTNPEALARAVESKGESLTRGLANLLGDVHKRRISQTDESAFEVGRNLAVSPGSVVFENELMQLIQYSPTTREVAARPLVMVPPCINKYYILDLQPENSFVGHAVASGNTVFMVSWRNVGPELGQLTWDDYLEKGVFSALRIARDIARADKVNTLGFCIGGTLLGAALAVLSAKKLDWVASATFLTTMLDFSDTGQIGVFVDEPSVSAREKSIGGGGIMPGSDLAFVFSILRANDLVWPYVVNNYLHGKRPAAFDVLYWNADSTNLPGPMFCYYLRNTYLENKLRLPGALENCGVRVDLRKVDLPVFVLTTREDHIVPWRSAYRTLGLLGGRDKTFILGAAGHIVGVINPLVKQRRSHWVGEPYPSDPDDWFSSAEEMPGSWWGRWSEWLGRHAGGKHKAPARPGRAKYKPIEPAPGRYVKHRIH